MKFLFCNTFKFRYNLISYFFSPLVAGLISDSFKNEVEGLSWVEWGARWGGGVQGEEGGRDRGKYIIFEVHQVALKSCRRPRRCIQSHSTFIKGNFGSFDAN